MRRSIAVFGLITLCAVPASAQEIPGTDPFVGCYAVELGEWQPALMAGNEPYQTPPDTVRLTEEVGGGSPFERGKHLVRPVIQVGRTPSAYWTGDGADAVQVVWTNGFAGVRLHLKVAEDGALDGVAEAHTDVKGPPVPTTEATLRPVQCADPR